jgi:O-antigen biosynthesis protein
MQALHSHFSPGNASTLIRRRLSAGWVRIRLKMTAMRPNRFRLYADEGEGFRPEKCLLNLEAAGAVDFDGFVHITFPVSALRFDPPIEAGEFQLESLQIDPLTSLQAFGHALVSKVKLLRKYRHSKQALWRALGMLTRGDLARIRHKLFRGLNGPDLEAREPYDEAQAYDAWRQSRRLTDQDRAGLRAEAAALADPPLFSVLLTLSGKQESAARRSIDSVLQQTYPFWELCIPFDVSAEDAVNSMLAEIAQRDARVQLVEIDYSSGTAAAVNAALACATGKYITLLDEGDELAEHALSKLSEATVRNSNVDMLYADEDCVTPEGKHVAPYFKPGWSPESLLAWMYTGRPGVYRTSLVRELGDFRAEFDAAYEYDLVLRMAARSPQVGRVADVLYHRGKTSAEQRSAPRYVRFALRGAPTVSIIIASACRRVRIRGKRTYYLLKCLESIKKSTWRHYQIVVLHGRQVPALVASELKQEGVVHVVYESPFNWSQAMNQGAALAQGEHLLFLNDDVEVITPDWLERLLEFSQQSPVGAVGAKLFFPSGRIQHAGVAVLDGRPLHPFYSHSGEHPGYFNNLLFPRNCSAVTGACLMTRAEVFREAGGFDEALPLNYNDVDYCLRLIANGKRVGCTPYARLYHHELGTRPAGVRPEETAALQQRWGKAWASDLYYNPHLSPSHFDYRIRSVTGESAGRHGPK